MSDELKGKILEVLKKYPVGSVATICDGKPWVRYMMMKSREDLTLYTTTFAASRKVAQIREDNSVHVTFGADPANWKLPYINVVGTAEILTDLGTKKQCWHEMLAQFFKGPEDPNYAVIKVTPTLIEYMSPESMEPEELKL